MFVKSFIYLKELLLTLKTLSSLPSAGGRRDWCATALLQGLFPSTNVSKTTPLRQPQPHPQPPSAHHHQGTIHPWPTDPTVDPLADPGPGGGGPYGVSMAQNTCNQILTVSNCIILWKREKINFNTFFPLLSWILSATNLFARRFWCVIA